MNTPDTVRAARGTLTGELFPEGVPALWCPSLTHYDREGAVDRARIAAHLAHLAPHVRGLLIPGSTGDAWELTETETREIIGLALGSARELKLRVLIGTLRPDAARMLQAMHDSAAQAAGGRAATTEMLRAAGVCGFTVCPPWGDGLAQEEIGAALSSVLEAGWPTAIYQLPQVTKNEIGPELASDLARRFANFIFFKDTSGADRVAESGRDFAGVFFVRGAEGDYARWLRAGGGPYDGLLLSTANCFARELGGIIRDLAAGRADAASERSRRLSAVVHEVFELVSVVRDGNAFANANKAMDHYFAHGPRAAKVPPPRLHAGCVLPEAVIRAAGEALARHGLMPAKGYLE